MICMAKVLKSLSCCCHRPFGYDHSSTTVHALQFFRSPPRPLSAALGKLARFAMEFCTVESCGKCTPCRIGSTRGVEVIDRILAGQETASNLALLDDLCDIMKDGSLCAMGGLTPLPVTSIRTHFPNELGDN